MSAAKEKLARFGRSSRAIEVAVNGESVTVYYRKPTELLAKRLVKAVADRYRLVMSELTNGDGESKSAKQRYEETFAVLDKGAVVDVIIGMEPQVYQAVSHDIETDPMPVAESEQEAWFAALSAKLNPLLVGYRKALEEYDFDTLRSFAVHKRLQEVAKESVFIDYFLYLIAVSLYESEDADTTLFSGPEEIEQSLTPGTIKALGDLITRELGNANLEEKIRVALL
jgi:hypothetical protein